MKESPKAIRVRDEIEFESVCSQLIENGYQPDPYACWSSWGQRMATFNEHVITFPKQRCFSIHNHEGEDTDVFTYDEFISSKHDKKLMLRQEIEDAIISVRDCRLSTDAAVDKILLAIKLHKHMSATEKQA